MKSEMPKPPSRWDELTYDEFLAEIENMKVWISKRSRSRAAWALSVTDYFEYNR